MINIKKLIVLSIIFISNWSLASINVSQIKIDNKSNRIAVHGIVQLDTNTRVSKNEDSAVYGQRLYFFPYITYKKWIYGASIFANREVFSNKEKTYLNDTTLYMGPNPTDISEFSSVGYRFDFWLPTDQSDYKIDFDLRPALGFYHKWHRGKFRSTYELNLSQYLYSQKTINRDIRYKVFHKLHLSARLYKRFFAKTRMKYYFNKNQKNQRSENYRWSQSFGYVFQRNFWLEAGHSLRRRTLSYSSERSAFKLYDKDKSKYFVSLFYLY